MQMSSEATGTLDQWVENGFINAAQREAIAELMNVEVDTAYANGCDDYRDDGYECGYDDGYAAAQGEWDSKRDEWFEQGWAEALLEHGIEE